jgi:hypothetical protein
LPAGWKIEDLRRMREEREQQAKEQFGMEQGNQPPEDDDEDEAQAKTLADLRAWRRKSSKRGKLAEFASDHIPAVVMEDVKAHSANGWRDAIDGVIAVYEGEDVQPTVQPAPILDTTELVTALRSATEALLYGQQPE